MKQFWDRVLLPLLVPLGALAIIAVIVLNVSRVLIALEERNSADAATAMAVVLSSITLFGFTYMSARGEARSSGNTVVLALSGLLVLFGGVVGAEAIQEKVDEEKAHEGAADIGPADVTVVAFDIGFREKQLSAAAKPAGIVVEYVNEGAAAHTFLFDEVPGFKLEVTSKGATDKARTSPLDPGTYTFFCDIPGHRAAGMEGQLNVTEGGGN